MNRDQASTLITQTFTRAFDKTRFGNFAINFLNRIDDSKAQAWNSQYIKDAFKDHVHRYERLGTYTSPDKEKLDVLIVYLTKESKLERARTAIRNFVAHHLKTRDEKEAALVAFVSPTEKQWRFSYVKMDYATVEKESGKVGIETRLTPARRFSYLVGEGESSHTAQTRFLGPLQDTATDPTLAVIEETFSVEAVTKEFFTKYAELFGDIHKALEKLVGRDQSAKEEFKLKGLSTVDFAKKLMGQIVFLYFLQKKGWLGVAKGQDWGSGPHDFLRRLANGEHGKYDNFFNDVLEPLFYDSLAIDRGHDAWCKHFNCRIPFLNGGLFEPLGDYEWRSVDIALPNNLFTNTDFVDEGITGTGVFDVFDRYNFTVNEAEPLETEVAIDPEMLGKVFENLIEENRRKGLGAYYTPRDIVHYMCQESLINYLDTALNASEETLGSAKSKQVSLFGETEPEQTAFKVSVRRDLVSRADIETFVHLGDQAALYEAARMSGTKSYALHLPKSIEKSARLIDEKLADVTICDPAVGSGAFPVGMMTEIVRARSSLTPYFNDVHERTPYHFKRHAIQSCLYGVDIDAGAVEIAKLRLWLSLVVDEEDIQQIKPLPNLDYKIVVGDSLLGVEKNIFNQEEFQRLEVLKPKFFDESDQKKKAQFKKQIETLIHSLTSGREIFDFEIYFSEVFHSKKGFDVVIANPPYVSVEKFARTALQKAWKRKFKTYAARGDIYCFFYERGLGLLRDGGLLTFISSNKFQRTGYGKGLRQLLASQRIHTLIDFCELPVFAAATDPMIVIVAKAAAATDDEFRVLVVKDEGEFSALPQSVLARASSYQPRQLKAEGWSLEGGQGFALIEKLRAKGTPLGTYVNGQFYYGIKTGLNEAFVIDRPTRDRLIREDQKSTELIKPWIRGKDIKRWTHEFHDLYVIIVRFGFHTELRKYPAILRHLSKFEEKLKARGQCKTSRSGAGEGQHHWLEWDNNPSPEYVSIFDSARIGLPTIKKAHGFSFVKGGRCQNNKTALFISADAQFLLSVMNSSITEWIVKMEFPSLGDPWSGGRIEYPAARVKGLPIPPANAADKSRLTRLAERAAELALADDGTKLAKVERQIDEIVFRLFDLSSEEIAQIETSLANTRDGSVGNDEVDEDE
jgi:type I restriction-modification system DNA methylase subunit